MDVKYITHLDEFRSQLTFENDHSVVLIVDQNTKELCLPLIRNIFPSNTLFLCISDQEKDKNIETCISLWGQLLSNNLFDRHGILINLGGGLVSDIGGFIASTFKRGIQYINIPTTLLSMVDAAFGGKTGINFRHYKNQIGTFYEPEEVLVFPDFLKTINHEHILSGFGEIIKYALIADIDLWDKLKNTIPSLDAINLDLLKKCIESKISIVKSDYLEKNIRKTLNFGHTIGHAFETFYMDTRNQPLIHGIAVANGILVESILSRKIAHLPDIVFNEIVRFVKSNYPLVDFNERDISHLIEIMKSDKKNVEGTISFVLITNPGSCLINMEISEIDIQTALNEYLVL